MWQEGFCCELQWVVLTAEGADFRSSEKQLLETVA